MSTGTAHHGLVGREKADRERLSDLRSRRRSLVNESQRLRLRLRDDFDPPFTRVKLQELLAEVDDEWAAVDDEVQMLEGPKSKPRKALGLAGEILFLIVMFVGCIVAS